MNRALAVPCLFQFESRAKTCTVKKTENAAEVLDTIKDRTSTVKPYGIRTDN